MGNLIKNQTEGQFKTTHKEFADYFEMLAKNDTGMFNKLRTDAGLTMIHVSDPALMHAAANELATTVLKETLRRQETTVTWLKEIEKIKKFGDAEGAKELDNMLEQALKTKNKADWDLYVQEQKTKLVEEGKTDLAASLGEVQEASANKWLELKSWKPLSAMKDFIPAMLAKHAGEYAAKLMENIDGYLREYLERSTAVFDGKKDMSREEKKMMAHELEEAQKAMEKLEEKGGNKKLFEKNFEKHLKMELAAMQKSISDESILKAVNKLNSDASKLDSADLMLENMHPSVAGGVLRAYRKSAADTAMAMA
ncbi:hypothetical protein H0O02_02210 [Candidatus Micrarchaeota archaeon]|nr:hypothetical protein [Candidatus Micrarchaeota archaeon]